MSVRINTKEVEFKSKVKPCKGWLVIDNITVKPRKNRTKDGYSYTFSVKGSCRRIYVHPSFVENGMVRFPIENAKAYEGENGIYIVPSENHIVHFIMLCSVEGMEPHIYVNGNSISYIPFVGYYDKTQFHWTIMTIRKGCNASIEYGLVHYGFFFEEWGNAKKVVEIKAG